MKKKRIRQNLCRGCMPKFLLKMKLLSFFILVSAITTLAANSYSQQTKFNISFRSATVREVLQKIEDSSEFIFLYSEKSVDVDRKVDVNVTNQTVDVVLDQLFNGTRNFYEIRNRQISILEKGSTDNSYLKVGTESSQQPKSISGKVTDSSGAPLPGVTVVIKGTSTGNITDANGNYSLSNISVDATLQFSFVGMKAQEVKVSGQTQINITLLEETIGIDEVVAVGYGTVKKSDLTGSLSSVSSKQFIDQPVKTVENLIQGRASGVQVTTLSGMPGGSVKVRIRGTTSINKSSDPLYVIDGIISSSGLEQITPTDIQSIEVLKDASSTAIYGSRGANGVVLVTTKKGIKGRSQLTFESSVGFSKMIINKHDLLSAFEYATALNDIKGSLTIPAEDMVGYKNGTKGIDYVNLMTQTGINRDYKLGISGGNEKTSYLVSANYLDWDAVTITSKLKRYNFRANIDSEVTPWLTLSASLNASNVHNHNGSVSFLNILNYSPTMELKNEVTGVYNKDPYNSVTQNPYGQRVSNYDDNYRYFLNANTALQFKIMDGLTFSVQGGYNYQHNPTYSFVSKVVQPGQIDNMSNSSTMDLYWQNTNNLTYSKTIGDHSFTLTGVWESSKTQSSYMNISGLNLNNEIVGYWNISNAATRDASNGYSEESMISGLGRLSYNYKSRYMLTGTFRADGSSKFIGDNKWGYFPSVAVGWDITNENFMIGQNIFQKLKLRASYGVTGNQAIDRYSTLGMLSTASFNWGTSSSYTGYWGNQFETPNLSWERTQQYNLGLDFSILDNRMNFTLDVFQKYTKDLLFRKRVPMYNGGGNFWVNQGEIKNSGIEFSVTAYPLKRAGDFLWETTFNSSYLKNEVVDLAGQDFVLDANRTEYGGFMQIMKPGYPYGSFYLYKWKGFDEEGANLYEKLDGTLTTSPTGSDQYIMGQSEPKFTFGWNNMVSWKNWNASIFFYAAIGFDRLNMTRFTQSSSQGIYRFIRLRDAYFKSWDYVDNMEKTVKLTT